MVARITHAKVSGRSQGASPTRIYGNHWDADHIVTGLENIDNTSDLNKPISTATQVALNAVSNGSATVSGRLTLQSGTPVMTTAQTAKTTIYFTPTDGANRIPIYDGVNLVPTLFNEISTTTTDTAKNVNAIGPNQIQDWFVWNDAGTIRLCHGYAWTSNSVRPSGIQLVNGVWINNIDISPGVGVVRGTYVGTTVSDASSKLNWLPGSAANNGGAALLHVWNCYNRRTFAQAASDSLTFSDSSSTVKQFHSSAGNQISFVLGLQEDGVSYTFGTELALLASSFAIIGAGQDSTTAFSGQRCRVNNPTASTFVAAAMGSGTWNASQGLHVLSLLQQTDGSNANQFNNSAAAFIAARLRM